MSRFVSLTLGVLLSLMQFSLVSARPFEGPIRVLFVGHDATNHRSDLYYPMLAKSSGRDAIYFDYVTTPEAAFADSAYLDLFDAVLLYANHEKIEPAHWLNLKTFIENGGGFVPVHCASWCFSNIPEFDQVVGGRFDQHRTGIFRAKTVAPKHRAILNVPDFEAWDETYVHRNHNPSGRTVLQVRDVAEGDNISKPEPWTWVREQGQGRVFYTASGHDERVWALPAFQKLLTQGILWSVGDERLSRYQKFIRSREPLRYEKVDNIPNYEKREKPLPKQFPLSAADSMKYTQTRADFRLELFASEPDIVNPICMAWDERGRLWVAETVDYPNDVRDGSGNDTIKILEDTDGDGKCDRVRVFAEGLNIPTSLTFWNGGVIVAQAPDFLFLKDEDGDDKADVRTTLFSGWGTVDTHAGPSNLRYGIDNWVYGAIGYSGFKGKINGKEHAFGSGIFRFKPDGTEIEFLHQFNNNTWGLGMNAAGDVFGSTANANPAFFGGFPQTGYSKGEKGVSAKPISDHSDFYPITPNVRQVDAMGLYTAGAGYAFATSDNFPKSFRDRYSFIGGPTGNLLGMFENVKAGAGYTALNRQNLIVSADEWFSPVAAEVGPDGNLWVADWYNFIIQHNPVPTVERGGYVAVKGKGNAHENPNRDKKHGRIYRAIWNGARPTEIRSLSGADDGALLAALSSQNQFWRLTAQRKIVAKRATGLIPKLKELVKKVGAPGSHALWTLDGLGGLDRETHQWALLQTDPVLKRNAIRAIPNTADGMQLFFDSAVVQAKDLQVRLAAFSKLAHFPDRERVNIAAKQLAKDPVNSKDEWLKLSLKACGGIQSNRGTPTFSGPNLLSNPSFEEVDGAGNPVEWVVRTYGGKADHSLDQKVARNGTNSLRISSITGADSSFFSGVNVEPNTDYHLSGWVRTELELTGARGAQMNANDLQGQDEAGRTNAFLNTKGEWKFVETVFNTLDKSTLTINVLFGGWGQSKGRAWWDDVSLRQASYPDEQGDGDAVGKGDSARGRKIFFDHPIAACIRCHTLGGKGGPIGPPLDSIASRQNREYLLESLVDPTAKMAEGFQAEVSPMPPMGVLLSQQELADVMAFLETLE